MPCLRASRNTASTPFLLMVFIVLAETLKVTHRFSSGRKNRLVCKFTPKRRRVLLCACETLLPDMGPLPVRRSFRAITAFSLLGGPVLCIGSPDVPANDPGLPPSLVQSGQRATLDTALPAGRGQKIRLLSASGPEPG